MSHLHTELPGRFRQTAEDPQGELLHSSISVQRQVHVRQKIKYGMAGDHRLVNGTALALHKGKMLKDLQSYVGREGKRDLLFKRQRESFPLEKSLSSRELNWY